MMYIHTSLYQKRISIRVVLLLCVLLMVSVFSACHQTDYAENESHDAYLDSVFKQAEADEDKAFEYVDSAFSVLEAPSIRDLYHKYFFMWYEFAEQRKDYRMAMLYADSTIGLMRDNTFNNEYVSFYARGFFMKGDVYLAQKNYTDAFQYYYKGREVIQNNADSCAVTEFTNRMAMVLYRQKHYKEAIVYYRQSIAGHYYCDNVNQRYRNEQRNINNIGLCYSKLGMQDSALYYFNKGIQFVKANRSHFTGNDFEETALGVFYGNKADVLLERGQIDSAEQLYTQSIKFNSAKNHDNRDAQFSQIKLAGLYLQTGRFDEAGALLSDVRKSLDTLPNEAAELRWWPMQKRYYDTTKQVEKAYVLFQNYEKLKDSLNTSIQLSYFDVNNEFEKIRQKYEYDLVKKQSEVKTVYLIISILFSIMAVVILIMAWSNRRLSVKNERELIAAKNIAVDAANAKQQFLSNMSHEIRTPMNAVIGITHLLIDEDPKPDQVEKLHALKFASENLLALLNDILDFSKIEAGKIVFEKINFSVRSLIDNIRISHQVNANKKNIQLYIEQDPNIPEMLEGDPFRLTQIINNLLSNAIKFTQQGWVRLAIRVESEIGNEVRLQFSVSDTGVGIDPASQAAIFESFTQAAAETTRQFGGTGLGLAITKRLLDMQGGTIQLSSQPGKGATFTFSLTFIKNETKAPDVEIKQEGVGAVAVDVSGYSVLIVDDNQMNIMVASRLIGRWGLKTETALSGSEALEKLKMQQFDIILMDLQMPIMSGYETCMRIRSSPELHHTTVPILALTADVMPETRERSIEAGMNDYISKPFDPDELHKKLVHYLKG